MTAEGKAVAEPPLDQPWVGAPFGAAFKRFWKKGFTFSGRASRSEYWKSYLANIVVFAGLVLLFGSFLGNAVWFVAILYGLATLIPSLAAVVRRLHDANQSGWMYFMSLIPLVGGIILLIMLAQESNPYGARFDQGRYGALPYGVPPGLGNPGMYPQSSATPPPVPLPPAGYAPAPEYPAPAATAIPPVPPPPHFSSAPPPPPAQSAPAPPAPSAPAPPAAGPVVSVAGNWMPPPAPASHPVAPPPAVPLHEMASPLDETRISNPGPVGGWVVELPDGRRLPADGSLFFGRDPITESGARGAVLVPVDEPSRSMSKTHARIDYVAGVLTVTDLHSTNGTAVTDAAGARIALTPGMPRTVSSSTEIAFGDYVVRLRRA